MLEHRERDVAAELRAAERRHVAPAELVQPARRALGDDARRGRVDAAREALAGDQHVRLDAEVLDAPQTARAPEAGLHLVGEVEGAGRRCRRLHRRQVAVRRHREAVRRGHRLQQHGRDLAAGQRALDRVDVAEGHLGEVGRLVGQEAPRAGVVARRAAEPGAAVVAGVEHDQPPAARGVPRGLDRDVDGLAAAAGRSTE